MGSCLGRFRWNRPGMAWTCELLACCCLLLHSAGAAPQQEFPSQFQQGLPRHIRQFASQHQGVNQAPSGGARSLFDSIVSKINAGHRENARSNPNYNPNIGTEAPPSASAPLFRPAQSFQAEAPSQEQPNLTPAFNQFKSRTPQASFNAALGRPSSPTTSQRRLPAPVPFRRQQTSSAAGQQSAGASSLALSLLQGQRVSPQQQPYYSQPVSPPAPVTPRLQPTTTTTVRPTSTARQVDVNAEYAALLEAHRLSNLEHQRRQLELLEEQKQVIEEQKKAQLVQQQQLEEKVAEEKKRRFTEQEKEQLQRQQENSIQVEKLAKAEAETPKAMTKPRRIRLRITSTSTQRPVVFSTTSTAEPATRPSTTLAPTSTTSTTSTTVAPTTTTTPPIIVPQAVHSAVSTLSAYLNPSSGEGAQLLEAPDHIWIALKELALFLKRSQLPV